MGATAKKGVSQPQNGYIDGVLSATTEGTTLSINVSTVSGYSSVTSILYAAASVNSGAAFSTSVSLPICAWTTTDATIKLTVDATLSTTAIGVRFVGQ
jgi:hypothetical protein